MKNSMVKHGFRSIVTDDSDSNRQVVNRSSRLWRGYARRVQICFPIRLNQEYDPFSMNCMSVCRIQRADISFKYIHLRSWWIAPGHCNGSYVPSFSSWDDESNAR